jgi:Protein of unknown function (DUF3592)
MKTNNPKIIGLVLLIVGLGVIWFWGSILYQISSLPLTGTTTEATVIGYKVSSNGARMVQNATSIKNFASGRSPFFEFVSDKKEMIKNYSNAPQIFVLFNYEIGEKITVAYPNNEPQKAVIINWKEFPGLLFMILFGLLMLIVGKSYFLNNNK